MSESALESLRHWKIKGFERTRQGIFSKTRTIDRCKPYGLKRVTPAKVTKADVEAAALEEKGGTAKARLCKLL